MESCSCDVLLKISNLLSQKALLALWQSSRGLKQRLTRYIRDRRRQEWGIALYKGSQTSELTDIYYLQERHNILSSGKYYLKQDLVLGDLTQNQVSKSDLERSYFILKDQIIHLNTFYHSISIAGGIIFYVENSSFYFNLLKVIGLSSSGAYIFKAVLDDSADFSFNRVNSIETSEINIAIEGSNQVEVFKTKSANISGTQIDFIRPKSRVSTLEETRVSIDQSQSPLDSPVNQYSHRLKNLEKKAQRQQQKAQQQRQKHQYRR